MPQILDSALTAGGGLAAGDPGAPQLLFRTDPVGFDVSSEGVAINYAVLQDSPSLSWSAKDRTATETYLMKAQDVPAFANGAIGLNVPWYNAPFMMRHKRKMPGNPDLICSRISARPFEPRPADPFRTDGRALVSPAEWNSVYSRHMVVTVEYSTEDVIEPGMEDSPQEDKPETFCEVKYNTSGEFLNVGQQNTWFIGIDVLNNNDGGFHFIAEDANDPNWRNNRLNLVTVPLDANKIANSEQNPNYEIAHSWIIPTREITVIWKHVFAPPSESIRHARGKVNSTSMSIFDFAPTECVLFVGETVTQESLRTPSGKPMYTIEYKFIEKQIRVEQVDSYGLKMKILGWNHFWRGAKDDESGQWGRLIRNKKQNQIQNPLDRGVYERFDFINLFRPDLNFFAPEGIGSAGLQVKVLRDNIERNNANCNTSA